MVTIPTQKPLQEMHARSRSSSWGCDSDTAERYVLSAGNQDATWSN